MIGDGWLFVVRALAAYGGRTLLIRDRRSWVMKLPRSQYDFDFKLTTFVIIRYVTIVSKLISSDGHRSPIENSSIRGRHEDVVTRVTQNPNMVNDLWKIA